MTTLAVFSGSRVRDGSAAFMQACELGKQLAYHDIRLICGGGGTGLMKVIADSVLERRGKVTAIIPLELQGSEILNPNISDAIEVNSILQRKTAMQDMADGFLLFSGGIGSMDEFFHVYSQRKLGVHTKPIGILNIDEFYSPLILMLRNMEKEGFVKEKHLSYLSVSDTCEDILKKMNMERVI